MFSSSCCQPHALLLQCRPWQLDAPGPYRALPYDCTKAQRLLMKLKLYVKTMRSQPLYNEMLRQIRASGLQLHVTGSVARTHFFLSLLAGWLVMYFCELRSKHRRNGFLEKWDVHCHPNLWKIRRTSLVMLKKHPAPKSGLASRYNPLMCEGYVGIKKWVERHTKNPLMREGCIRPQ